MKIIITMAVLGFIGILLFALGVITGAAVVTEMKHEKEEPEDER